MNKPTKILLLLLSVFAIFYLIAIKVASDTEKTFAILSEKVVNSFKDGDIIFQTLQSKQCEAVRIATNSKFSHCGIIFNEKGKCYVYEAIQPVKKTLLSNWITHGEANKYLVMRLKDSASLNQLSLDKMQKYGKKLLDKDYDIYFEWSDENIYCSEYVWKIYKYGANVELCKLEKLKSFNLDDKRVRAILSERYGTKIPLNEDVVAPSQLAKSDKLITIFDNY